MVIITSTITSVARGILEGAGLDQLLWTLSKYFPDLAKSSPIKIPFYDPSGVHYDDLIGLGAATGWAVASGIKKDWNGVAEGVGALVGMVFVSRYQPYPAPLTGIAKARSADDLVRVD